MNIKNKLTGINIRKGLELNIPISEIFSLETESEGDILAMKLNFNRWNEINELTGKTYEEVFKNGEGLIYSTKREKHSINETLDAYVRETYMCFLEENDLGFPKITTERFTEIDFVNTEMLTFHTEDLLCPGFVENIMAAQEFSGKFEDSGFKNRFIGIGNFTLEEYSEYHNIIIYANIHLLDFFIFSDNILSSIGNFLLANYVRDLEEQKEYFNDEQYELLHRMATSHKNAISSEFVNIWKSITGNSGTQL